MYFLYIDYVHKYSLQHAGALSHFLNAPQSVSNKEKQKLRQRNKRNKKKQQQK